MVVGATGFIGSSILSKYSEKGLTCISVGRQSLPSTHNQYLNLDDFYRFKASEFLDLRISRIVYAIGSPKFQGKSEGEYEILDQFLKKLEEFGYEDEFLLISSNAANPDSGYAKTWYRKRIFNDYILRKLKLEERVLSSNLNCSIIRAPAVIGINMKDQSHIKRIIGSKRIQSLMSLPIFAGTVEIITVSDLFEEIEKIWKIQSHSRIFEPSVPAYRWSRVARHLRSNIDLECVSSKKFPFYKQLLGTLMPTSIRFLMIPHWMTKGASDKMELNLRHTNVVSTLRELRQQDLIRGKQVVVTGAASGLGSIVCSQLIERGYEVIGIDIVGIDDNPNLQSFCQNERFRYLRSDLSSKTFSEECKILFDSLNIFGIFCIAGTGPRNQANFQSLDSVRKIFEVNFLNPLQLLKHLVNAQVDGSYFVFVGSSSGILGVPNFAAYAASKAALHSYFFSLLCENPNGPVKILGVIPSGMKTNFQSNNNVPVSSLDKLLLADPGKIATFIVDWAELRKKKSRIVHFGFSSFLFNTIRNLPFMLKVSAVRRLSEGRR